MDGLPEVGQRTLDRAFRRALDAVPEKTAFIEPDGREWTYRAVHDAMLAVAGGLEGLGIEEQESIALLLDNSLDFLTVAFGLGVTRRVQVPINTAYKGEFLAYLLQDSGVRAVVAEGHYVGRLAAIEADVPKLTTVVVRGDDRGALGGTRFHVVSFDTIAVSEPAAEIPSAPDDLMALMYTSGTTGRSKGVEVTQAHAYTYASREDARRPNSDDTILVMLPMFHLAGQWYGAYQSVIARATAVIQPSFSASRFWGWIRDFNITELVMLGAVAEVLQQAEPRPDDAEHPLSFAVMAPMASDFEGFRARFGIELGAVYGMSEIGAVMFSDPPGVVGGEAGRARSGYTLHLVDESGRVVPDGVPGELALRPDSALQVMRGYHGLPEKTAEMIVDGWVYTGDIFVRDADGHFFFVDRSKDALRRRGENISSFEVERVINRHPAVYESAVVAVPSDMSDDEIKAVVVVRTGHLMDFPELIDFLVSRLPYFMVPRYVEELPELPKTPTQKVRKHELRGSVGGHVWDRTASGTEVDRRA